MNTQNIKALHLLILDVLNEYKNSPQILSKLSSNIIIYASDDSGVCTLQNSRNFEKRLTNELTKEFVNTNDIDINDISFDVECIPENGTPFYCASYISRFAQFSPHWLTKKEYINHMNINNKNSIQSLYSEKWTISKAFKSKFAGLLSSDKFYRMLFKSTSTLSSSVLI